MRGLPAWPHRPRRGLPRRMPGLPEGRALPQPGRAGRGMRVRHLLHPGHGHAGRGDRVPRGQLLRRRRCRTETMHTRSRPMPCCEHLRGGLRGGDVPRVRRALLFLQGAVSLVPADPAGHHRHRRAAARGRRQLLPNQIAKLGADGGLQAAHRLRAADQHREPDPVHVAVRVGHHHRQLRPAVVRRREREPGMLHGELELARAFSGHDAAVRRVRNRAGRVRPSKLLWNT